MAGWATATIVAYALYPQLLPVLLRPPIQSLVYTSPVEPFFAQVKVSMVAGILLAFPWMLYQAIAFVSIGLKPQERLWVIRLIPASYALFLAGGAVGLFIIGPIGLKFLMAYSTSYLVPYITLNAYLGYLAYLTLGLAVLFQLPIVLFVLAALKLLRLETLTRHRRQVFLGLLILAAIVTPGPDIFSQVLVAVPAYLLYELSIAAVWLLLDH